MKFYKVYIALAIVGSFSLSIHANFYYGEELKAFTKFSPYRSIFDKNTPVLLQQIQRDIENFKELTPFQRLVRFAFLSLDVIVITPYTLPKLYAFIDQVCKEHDIKTPTIFVTRGKGFFNAAAQKLLASSGAIIIGQKLLLEVTDEELEAVLAHEIGHIKHNHINKMMAVLIGSHIAAYSLVKWLYKKGYFHHMPLTQIFFEITVADFLAQLIINKRFERQADEFAYHACDKGEGLIKLFERIIAKEEREEDAFLKTYEMLQNNREHLASRDYMNLLIRYYLARGGHYLSNGYKWLYYNTAFGPHPSPETRIQTIQEYLDNKG